MGIKTKISKKQLPKKYQKYNLIETVDGISDSVYLLDNIYVLKLFENQTKQQILNEQNLLNKLKNLKVPKVIDIFTIDNKQTIIYTQILGNSIKQPKIEEIKQIGIFLKQQHNLTRNEKSSNIKLFEHKRVEELIISSKNEKLLKYFLAINIELKNDGIIHGDIFTDNVKFKDNKLMGVYDYNEACEGDFIFDLAVVSLSWCFDNKKLNNEKLKILLDAYNIQIDKITFVEYIKYALIYYSTMRYINSYNNDKLVSKLESLCKCEKDSYGD